MIKDFKLFENQTDNKFILLISDNYEFDFNNGLYYYDSVVDCYNDFLFDVFERVMDRGMSDDYYEEYSLYLYGNNQPLFTLNKYQDLDDVYVVLLDLMLNKYRSNGKIERLLDIEQAKKKYPHLYAGIDMGLL